MVDGYQTSQVLVVGDITEEVEQLVRLLRHCCSVFHAHTREEIEEELQGDVVLVLAEQRLLERFDIAISGGLSFTDMPFWIILTQSSDSKAFTQFAVQDHVYHVISAPWHPEEVAHLACRAVEHYHLVHTNKKFPQLKPLIHTPQTAAAEKTGPSSTTSTKDATGPYSQAELEASCQELQKALGKVVQSEKMVILGQMVAGIAHEINTPSGAINAAVVNMSHHMKLLLQSFAEFDAQRVTREDFQKMRRIVTGMLARSDKHERKTSGEIRNEQKRLADILNQQNVPHGRKIAKGIARMGLSDDMDELLVLTHTYNANSILQFFTHCNRIINSVNDIQLSIDMLTRIIRALKSYSYPWQEKPEIADIHESINTALVLLNNKLKHRIHVELRFGDLPNIWCYPSELSHVWINIIHNAIQAIKDKGTIDIETCVTEDAVEVKITDNGVGIPADIQYQIFEINFTTKAHEDGTGLGLYIAHQIIEKHHGTVRVTSVPGQTTFEVRLPLKLVI